MSEQTVQGELVTEEPTAADVLESVKQRQLGLVETAARNVTRTLNEIVSAGQAAQYALMNGRLPSHGFVNHGPLGHQAPADLTAYSVQLEEAITVAVTLGVGELEIAAVVRKGVNAL